jgi:hypothetical protein
MILQQNNVTKKRNVKVVVCVALLVISIPLTSVVVLGVDVSHGYIVSLHRLMGHDEQQNEKKPDACLAMVVLYE